MPPKKKVSSIRHELEELKTMSCSAELSDMFHRVPEIRVSSSEGVLIVTKWYVDVCNEEVATNLKTLEKLWNSENRFIILHKEWMSSYEKRRRDIFPDTNEHTEFSEDLFPDLQNLKRLCEGIRYHEIDDGIQVSCISPYRLFDIREAIKRYVKVVDNWDNLFIAFAERAGKRRVLKLAQERRRIIETTK